MDIYTEKCDARMMRHDQAPVVERGNSLVFSGTGFVTDLIILKGERELAGRARQKTGVLRERDREPPPPSPGPGRGLPPAGESPPRAGLDGEGCVTAVGKY